MGQTASWWAMLGWLGSVPAQQRAPTFFPVVDGAGKPLAGAGLRATNASFALAGGDPLAAQRDRLAKSLWSAYAARPRSDARGNRRVPVFLRPGFDASVAAARGTRTSDRVQLEPGGEAEVVLGR